MYVDQIRDHFLGFMVSLFKNYEKYVVKEVEDTNETGTQTSFLTEEFLKREYKDKYDFFKDLFNTRAWILFLENKLYASTIEAENQIDYFDGKIYEKYNKKKFKELSNKKDKDENKQTEYMPARADFDNEFRNYKTLESKYLKHVDDFGVPYEDFLDLMENKGNSKFVYVVIPDFSATSIPNEKDFPKENFAHNLCIKDEKVKRTEQIMEILENLKTYTPPQHIMVSWVLLWCMSFKYLQSIEKRVRIQELIIVLKRLFEEYKYPKNNIRFLEYIMLAILEHGKKEHMDTVIHAIKDCNIPYNIKMKQYYFKCVDKHELQKDKKSKSRLKKYFI
jgi:hypothetical protein